MLRLYRANFSTNAERVALALAHKGIEVESRYIDYADRSEVEEISGQGFVPVLVDGSKVIVDSMRIIAYLDENVPQPAAVSGRRRALRRDDVLHRLVQPRVEALAQPHRGGARRRSTPTTC